MSASLIRDTPLPRSNAEKNISKPSSDKDKDWFNDAHKFLIEGKSVEFHPLIGHLYKLAEKFADDDQNLFLRNPDSKAFASAFKRALEHGKHGTELDLPMHLYDEVKPKYREHFNFT